MRPLRFAYLFFAFALVAAACAPAAPPPTPIPAAPAAPTRVPIATVPPTAAPAATATPDPSLIAAVKKAETEAKAGKLPAVPTAPVGTQEAGLIPAPPCWSPKSAVSIQPLLIALAGPEATALHARYYVTDCGIPGALSFYQDHLITKDGWSGGFANAGNGGWIGKFSNGKASDLGYVYIYKGKTGAEVQILEKSIQPQKPGKVG